MNFKVGDIVTGKKDNGYHITTDKAIMKIVDILRKSTMVFVEVIEHDKHPEKIGWRYKVELESITPYEEKNSEIILYKKGNKVIAEYKKDNIKAIARCSPEDEFNFMVGAKLALERLDEMLNPPLYYIKFTDHIFSYLNVEIVNGKTLIRDKMEDTNYKTKFTLDEIKEINPNYIPFAIKVEEDK